MLMKKCNPGNQTFLSLTGLHKKTNTMELAIERSFRHWWAILLRGILFLAVGIYMICSPVEGIAALGLLFGVIIFIAGIAELLHVVRSRNSKERGWHLALGIIDIILGIVLIGHIAASVTILRIIVGVWFVFKGISLFSFSRAITNSWLLKVGGIVTVIFGLLIIFNGVFGSMTIVLFTAIAFIIIGFFNIWLGYRMKQHSV
jgi:uncharacterized membrane protein HdeD (DUF308 family)